MIHLLLRLWRINKPRVSIKEQAGGIQACEIRSDIRRKRRSSFPFLPTYYFRSFQDHKDDSVQGWRPRTKCWARWEWCSKRLGKRPRGAGYTSKPKTLKVGLYKELENHIFDYGISNAANNMRTTQEKITQYVGIKYEEDIANELTNKTTVIVAPPVYSAAIMLRHQEWEVHVRKK